MTVDLIVEKLIEKIKSQKDAENPSLAKTEGPAFVKFASATEEAIQEAIEEIALLAETHAEEAEEDSEQRASEDDEEDEEEDADKDGESEDQALENSTAEALDEVMEVALADASALESAEDVVTIADTADAASFDSGASASTSGSGGGGFLGMGWVAPALALGGGAVAGVVAAATGSSSDGEPSVLSGTVMMGPVTRGLSVTAYDVNGNVIGTGDIDENGQYSVDVGDYNGIVMVRLSDQNAEEGNYIDEARGGEVDLTVDLRAMSVASGGEVVLNITPLTELAVRKMGLPSTGEVSLASVSATEAQVAAANEAIARLFLGSDGLSVETADILPVVDRDGNDTADSSNVYGKVLAALSGADASETLAGALGMEATLAALDAAITDVSAGAAVTWEDQVDEGVIAREIIQFGLERANDNPDLEILDDSFLDDLGIRTDSSGPVIADPTVVIDENTTASITLSAEDETGVASWALASGEGDANNDLFELTAAGELSLKVAEDFETTSAPFSIRVAVTDTLGNVAEQIITVNIGDVNEAPTSTTFEDQSTVNFEDVAIDVSGAFSDVDAGDAFAFTAEGLPEGYVIDRDTGVISGQTAFGGDAEVTVTATDSGGLSASETFTISVLAAPVVLAIEGISPTLAREGETIDLALKLSEAVTIDTAGGDPIVTFSLNGETVVATYNGQDAVNADTLLFSITAPTGDGAALEIASIDLNGATVTGDATQQAWLVDSTSGRTSDALTIDNTAPTLEISVDKDLLLEGETATVTFMFSEAPGGFEEGDITVNGGVLSGFQADPENPAVYTAVFTPTAEAEGTATIEVSAYADLAGNNAVSGETLDFEYDTSAPAITAIDFQTANGLIMIDFDQAVEGFTRDDIAVTGGTLGELQMTDMGAAGVRYTASYTGELGFTGAISASIAAGSYQDASGNAGGAGAAPTLNVRVPTASGLVNAGQFKALTVSGSATNDALVSFIVVDKTTLATVVEALNPSVLNNQDTGIGSWSITTNLEALNSGTYFIQAAANIDGDFKISGVVAEFTLDRDFSVPVISSAPTLIEEASFDNEGFLEVRFTADDDLDFERTTIEWDDGVTRNPPITAELSFDESTQEYVATFSRDDFQNVEDGEGVIRFDVYDIAGNSVDAFPNLDPVESAPIRLELENQAPVSNIDATIPQLIVLTGSDSAAPILNLNDFDNDGDAMENDRAFTDADAPGSVNATLTYSGVNLPSWLTVTQEGIVRIADGQTAPSTDGVVTITVRASDGTASAERPIDIELISAPTVTTIEPASGATAVQEGDALAFNVSFSEGVSVETNGGANLPTLTLNINGATVTATYEEVVNSNILRFTATAPSNEGNSIAIAAINLNGATVTGDISATAWATDAVGQSTSSITVDNTGPSITTTSLSVNENATVVGTLAATDTYDNDVEWRLKPGEADNAEFTLAPDGTLTLNEAKDFEADAQSYSIVVEAIDDAGNVTEKTIAVTLSDVNEQPEASGQTFDPQSVNVGADAGTTILDLTDIDGVAVFTDPDGDMTSFGTLTYEGVGLPEWLVVTPEGLVQVKAGSFAPSSAEDLSITVRARDGGGLTAERNIDISVVSAPALTAMMNGVGNLDVRSDLVMTASENVALTAVDGVYDITIEDRGGVNSGQGFSEEANDNTQTIRITINASGQVETVQTLVGDPASPSYTESHANIADVLTITGDQITINPFFDLDLSSDYRINVSEGLFTGADSSQPSFAFDGSAGEFSTVNPEGATRVATAEQAQWFENGSLVNSHQWVMLDGVGDSTGGSFIDIGSLDGGAYVLVLKDWDIDATGEPGTLDQIAGDGGVRSNGFFVFASDFGLNDLVYADDQYNDANVNAPGDTSVQWDSENNATRIQFGGVTGEGPGLLLLQAADGIDFSGAQTVDNPQAMGVNLSEVLNGFGVSPVIAG